MWLIENDQVNLITRNKENSFGKTIGPLLTNALLEELNNISTFSSTFMNNLEPWVTESFVIDCDTPGEYLAPKDRKWGFPKQWYYRFCLEPWGFVCFSSLYIPITAPLPGLPLPQSLLPLLLPFSSKRVELIFFKGKTSNGEGSKTMLLKLHPIFSKYVLVQQRVLQLLPHSHLKSLLL